MSERNENAEQQGEIVETQTAPAPAPEAPQTDVQSPAVDTAADPTTDAAPTNPAPAAEEIANTAPKLEPGPHQGVGTMGHYRAANSGEMPGGNEYHAAIVTHVSEDQQTVDLTVFPRNYASFFVQGVQVARSVNNGEGFERGTWRPKAE